MRLIDDWDKVLQRAWSVKFAILTLVAATLEALLPFLTAVVPAGIFATVAVASSLLTVVSRLLQQQGIRDDPQK